MFVNYHTSKKNENVFSKLATNLSLPQWVNALHTLTQSGYGAYLFRNIFYKYLEKLHLALWYLDIMKSSSMAVISTVQVAE